MAIETYCPGIVVREESEEAWISGHCGDLQVTDFAGLVGMGIDNLAN